MLAIMSVEKVRINVFDTVCTFAKSLFESWGGPRHVPSGTPWCKRNMPYKKPTIQGKILKYVTINVIYLGRTNLKHIY